MCRYAVRIIPKRCPDVSEISVRMRPKYSTKTCNYYLDQHDKCFFNFLVLDEKQIIVDSMPKQDSVVYKRV